VVIAAYEASATIAEAVESAMSQSHPPLEIIVSDDGSKDDLARALRAYTNRIKLLKNRHAGPSAARNAAVAAASGHFVAILDADDVFEPDRLAALAELSRARPELDILASDAILEREGRDVGRFYRDDFTFAEQEQRLEILRRCFLCAPAVRRSRLADIGGFDEAFLRAEDWDCWLRAILAGARAGLVDAPLLRYRLGTTSLTADRLPSLRARVSVLEKAARRTDLSPSERRYLERALDRRRWDVASAELREGVAPEDPHARRAAFAVTRRNDLPSGSRLKAAAFALSPGLALRASRRRAVRDPNS
jgi:glycosyltransferase involved in cell wall biosynthesis